MSDRASDSVVDAAGRASGAVLAEDQLLATMAGADAPKPGNVIHSTDGARAFGYVAALIGGATVYGWTVRTIVRALGERWLDDGWLHVRFRKPTYPGDQLRIRVFEGGAMQVTKDDAICIEGTLGLGSAPWLAELRYPRVLSASERPLQLPRLTPDNVPVGRVLAARAVELCADAAVRFSRDEMFEADPRFVGAAPRAHPAWLAMQPIDLLHHNFDYGPAIHAESHIQHLARAASDTVYLVAGEGVAAFERKGHHYLVNDCLLRDGAAIDVARIRHTVIYRVAARG